MPHYKQGMTAFLTLAILLGAYFIYAQTVGGLTDFPQLPKPLEKANPNIDPVTPNSLTRESLIAAQRGFGPGCDELDAPMKLESRKPTGPDAVSGRGIGFFVFGGDYEIIKDNPRRMRIWPFSLVHITASPNGNPDEDEISTVRGKEAILEFDRPIRLPNISGVKPVAGWVWSDDQDVELRTNRRTCGDKTDDVSVFTDRLYYSEERNLIWADNQILVVAGEDTRIEGVGMELELIPKPKPGDPVPKKTHDAKRVRLVKDVRFVLPVDDDANFLGAPAAKDDKSAAKSDKKVSPVTITANGTFDFDLIRDHAVFEKSVLVLRENLAKPSEKGIDQLVCDRLELQFEPQDDRAAGSEKPNAVAPGATQQKPTSKRSRPLKLQHATATGANVVLQSDSQRLMATGNRLFHDTKLREATLSGDKEMIAYQDNTIIHGRLLKISQGEKRDERTVIALGPNGWLDIFDEPAADKKNPAIEKPSKDAALTIRWQGQLSLTNARDAETKVVVIDNGVELDDKRTDGRGGAMTCQWLKVWLTPVDKARAGAGFAPNLPAGDKDGAKSGRKLEPVALEARGEVSAGFPDLLVNTDNLRMEILYPKESEVGKPVPAQPNNDRNAHKPAAKNAKHDPPLRPAGDEQTEPSADPPLDVRANSVVVVVERRGARSTPVRAWAEGNVHVTQASQKADDEPMRVHGQKLDFQRLPAGDVLKVFGSEDNWARIEATEMILAGKQQIHIDEPTNRVHVVGVGFLDLRRVDNDLTGKSTRPGEAKPLRIDWNQSMDFDGKFAVFEGAVRAQQAQAEVRCQNMEVSFDRTTVFKDLRQRRNGNDKDKSKIVSVICDKDVVVYDQEIEDGKVARYTSMRVPELQYDNLESKMRASGRGVVRIVEPAVAERDAKGNLIAPKLPWQMTQVTFLGQMRADNKHQLAKFLDNVEIINTPVTRPDEVPDADKPTPESMSITAREYAEMQVIERDDGAKYRVFRAKGNIYGQSREFTTRCDRLSFDGAHDKLVFESDSGRKATFYKQDRVGAEPTAYIARRVEYWRKTGDVRTDEAEGFQGIDITPGNRQIRSR